MGKILVREAIKIIIRFFVDLTISAIGLRIANLHKYLPGFRTPFELAVNEIFFKPLESCNKIISMLKYGFTAD